jgi:hypothetical protein
MILLSGCELSGGLFLHVIAEGHAKSLEHGLGVGIACGRGDKNKIESNLTLDLVELDFRKNRLIGKSYRIVPASVK